MTLHDLENIIKMAKFSDPIQESDPIHSGFSAMFMMLVVISCSRSTVTQSLQKYSFKPVVSSSDVNEKLCAIDRPQKIITSVKSLLHCSAKCSADDATAVAANYQKTGCRYFNYKLQSSSSTAADGSLVASTCELYYSLPNCSVNELGCTLYRVRNLVTRVVSVIF